MASSINIKYEQLTWIQNDLVQVHNDCCFPFTYRPLVYRHFTHPCNVFVVLRHVRNSRTIIIIIIISKANPALCPNPKPNLQLNPKEF